MKDGSTHLAHKAEHAVDLSSGALLAVTVQGADQGDTTTGACACIFACLGLLILYVWSMLRTGFRFNIAKEETAVTF